MSDAQLLAQCLLEADKKFGAKAFLKGLTPKCQIIIRLGPPISKIVRAYAKWEDDIIYQGGGMHPGVVMRGLTSPPQGLTEQQWDEILETIEYGFNEGYQEWSGSVPYEPEEADRDDDWWHPTFSWQYYGGLDAFKRDQAAAMNRQHQ